MNERLAWRSARLEFTKTPLAEAVDLFNRYKPASAARLELADPALAGVRVTGVFRADNVEAFVLLLEGAFDVKADRAPGLTQLRKAAN
jgi:transmembrane sensor